MRCALAGAQTGMAKWTAALIWSLSWLLAWQAQAAVDIATPSTVINPAPQVAVLEDETAQLGIEQILEQAEALPWQMLEQEVPNFGFTHSAWWLKLELANASHAPLRRLLELASPLPDFIDAYAVDAEGRVLQQWSTGSRRPFASRPVRHHSFVLPVHIGANETRHVYLRLASHDGLVPALPMLLMDDASFLQRTQSELMAYSVLYGGLLALLLYNLLTFVATREKAFLHSVFYLGAFLLFNLSLRGFGYQFLWPEWPRFNQQVLLLSAGLLYVALTLFSLDYLSLKRQAPRLAKGLVALTGLLVLSVLPSLADRFAWALRALVPLSIGYALLLLGASAWLSFKGDRLARIFLLGWSGLLAGSVLYALRLGGFVPYGLATEYALELGAGFGFLLLAFGLACKINYLKRAKLEAERETYELQRTLNHQLETKVHQRTQELEQANHKLAAMVRTDPLTGLLNRRQFETLINEEIQRRQRDGKPLLFAMMDIDDFKLFNDTYGHQAGDQVLIEVADLLKAHFRRAGDRLFRLGGEEFGILLEADSLEAGRYALERFRHALQQLQIPHEASRHGVVTGSFGLVCCSDYDQVPAAMAIYRQADQAMYEAKQISRNRVVTRSLMEEV
ncbi:diguanylate cyclase [Billgrantia aerodenitrificans]|uniref:diguanylate cyclase n=2 Tax=Billgrantia TaxID=3137761 RepID=A0ABS9AUL6_9GAMM|nr:diguanylate cyclase [Halomonas aerodenitrificans]MCE8025312.1 GGDEF domain-containing protein [Halomonas aerodenitrificans]